MRRKRNEGIVVKHARSCSARSKGVCNCTPTYQAWVWSKRDRKKLYETFPTLAAAKSWRGDAGTAVRRGSLAVQTRVTVEEAAEKWLEDAKAGRALTRSGTRYKPSLIRTHESDLRRHITPAIGGLKLSELRQRDVQALVDRLVSLGYSGSRVRGAIMPLRVICRRAIENDELLVNPTLNLRLPANGGSRERAASPEEAAELLAALAEEDQPLWATAFFGGLRRGELRGLRVADVNFPQATVIHVQRSWDDVEGAIAPKSKHGGRKVPVPAVLRRYLLEQKVRTGRDGDELLFGRTARDPFTSTHVRAKGRKAWDTENERRTEEAAERGTKPELLEPITLHECRHTYVSLMHAASVPLERIGDYVGHSGTYMTERYRHLVEGQGAKDAAGLDKFLTGAHGGAQGRSEGRKRPS